MPDVQGPEPVLKNDGPLEHPLDLTRVCLAAGLTLAVSTLLTVWCIHSLGNYGVALFLLIPLFLGAAPTLIYGCKLPLTPKQSCGLGTATLGIFAAGLLLLALEGAICIAMAAPIALILNLGGSAIGYFFSKKTPVKSWTALLVLLCSIPGVACIEEDRPAAMTAVVTSIEVNADPEKVWNQVTAFPELPAPTEFIFKAGISYPISASIEGTGVGALRYCNFSTGSFVEPITAWEKPRLLAFDVIDQPEPMKELSFWDIDAPHLHDYFVSKRGQFKLTGLPGGRTLLEGTTWYTHRISPVFYWRLWSKMIVHSIHERVLNHIKRNSERESKTPG